MFKLNQEQSDFLQHQLQKDQKLLDSIKAKIPDLERLAVEFQIMYEDGIYRFYHHSFKVYNLQSYTVRAANLFRSIVPEQRLCGKFEEIVAAGTDLIFQMDHNQSWLFHTQPIMHAFLHSKYFLDMMLKFARELDSAPTILPSGWAAILELYNQR